MMVLSYLIMTAFLISMVMLMAAMMTSKKTYKDREKLSPFECGFDPLKKSRIPFSLRFFIITVVFLIFEVEISLLLPLGLLTLTNNFNYIMICAFLITIVLIMGLLHEWSQGSLNWIT